MNAYKQTKCNIQNENYEENTKNKYLYIHKIKTKRKEKKKTI